MIRWQRKLLYDGIRNDATCQDVFGYTGNPVQDNETHKQNGETKCCMTVYTSK